MPDPTQLLTTSRPSIYIEGNHHPRLSGDLVQLETEETLSAPTRCRATFINVANVRIDASKIELNAAMVDVNSGMTKFSGVVQSDTVITNSIVASFYTPGAGNIW